MSFKDNYKEKVNKAGEYVLPVILVLVGIAVGSLLLGVICEGLWFCISWCLEQLWKILIVAVIIFIVVAIIMANSD